MSSRSGNNQIVVITREKHKEYLDHIGDFRYIRENIESRKENIIKFEGDTDSQKKGFLASNLLELEALINDKGYFVKAEKHYSGLSSQHNKGDISDEEITFALNELYKIIKYFEGEELILKKYNAERSIKRRAKSASISRTNRGGSIIKRLPVKPKAKPPVKPKAKPVKPKVKPVKSKVKPVKPKVKPVKPKAKPVKAK